MSGQERHPLDLAAMAAYGAFTISSADRLGEMPPWEALPPDAQADWRAVADAVLMVTSFKATPAHNHPTEGMDILVSGCPACEAGASPALREAEGGQP